MKNKGLAEYAEKINNAGMSKLLHKETEKLDLVVPKKMLAQLKARDETDGTDVFSGTEDGDITLSVESMEGPNGNGVTKAELKVAFDELE